MLLFLPVHQCTLEGVYNCLFLSAFLAIFSRKIGQGTEFLILLAIIIELPFFSSLVTDQFVYYTRHLKLCLFCLQYATSLNFLGQCFTGAADGEINQEHY